MPLSRPLNTNVVFFTNIEEVSGPRRMVRIRQFVEEGLGGDVEVIENFIFSVQFQFAAILVVKSDSLESIKNAIEPAKEEFAISIIAAEAYSRFNAIEKYDSCLLLAKPQEGMLSLSSEISDAKTDLNIHSIIDLSDQSPYDQLVLFNSENTLEVHSHANKYFSDCHPFISNVQSAKDYLVSVAQPPKKEEYVEAVSDLVQFEKRQGRVVNQGSQTNYYAFTGQDTPDFQAFRSSRLEIRPTFNSPAVDNVYFWKTKSGVFNYVITHVKKDRTTKYDYKSVPTNAPLPSNIHSVASDEKLFFDLNRKENTFYHESPAGKLLYELINTTIHDDVWKQDNYKTKEEQDAYKYIISALNANDIHTLPRQGSLTERDVNKVRDDFPANSPINKEAFDRVIGDLLDVIDWINVSKEWFGDNGVFHSLIMEIVNIAHLDLTAVANLMKIPPKTSKVGAIIEMIINDLLNFVGAIPDAGPTIAAAIRLGWSTAKLEMQNGEAERPVEVAIADMATYIINFWEKMKTANETNLSIIIGNWGKLYTFANAIKNQIITPQQFGLASTSDKSSQAYMDAIVKAWRVICYKQILKGRSMVKSTINFSEKRPTPLFNRISGKYGFSYSLKCEYRDASGNKFNGWANVVYSRPLSQEVLDDLFNVKKLNLNPVEFYMGYNGWETNDPVYFIRLSTYFVPVLTIG